MTESWLARGAREGMEDLDARAARHLAAVQDQVERIRAVPVVLGGGEVAAEVQKNITAADELAGVAVDLFDTARTDSTEAVSGVDELLATDRSAVDPLTIRV